MKQRLIDANALIESMTKFSNATGEDMTHGIFYAHKEQKMNPCDKCKKIKCRRHCKPKKDWMRHLRKQERKEQC